ncbi:MAG: TMEM165/GDT1 family protein [Halobacteriota archaeon]|uniref:TMEM165/GDT1 family protein n=1 Tax=Natronomonas sp. TaxID=2184060 RepID=UPI003975A124
MTEWFDVLVIAFVAQLAVLPGEKVQFIIAGLSTRYHPFVVVSAAASAFAGWTALEVWFGGVLQRTLSPVVLDGITAGLFFLFGVLLWRSMPGRNDHEPTADGGLPGVDGEISILGREVPDRFGTFLPIFAMMAAGEFGDKTQLVTIGLAAQYSAGSAIWLGEMLAIVPVSLVNAFFFHRFSGRFDVRKAHAAGAVMFLFFGADTVLAMTTDVSVWDYAVSAVSGLLATVR